MTHFFLAVGFGVATLASAIMAVMWAGVARDNSRVRSHALGAAAWSLSVGKFGLTFLLLNRTLEEMTGNGLAAWLLYVMLAVTVAGNVALMASSAVEGSRHLLGAFLIACVALVAGLALLAFS